MSRCRFRIPACIRSRLRASRVCSLSPRIWPSRDDLDPRSNRRPRSRRIAPICGRYCGKSINLHSNPTHGISLTYWPTIIHCATNIQTDTLRHSIAYWFDSPVWLCGKSIKLHRNLTLWFLVSYLLSTICFATRTQASNALRDSNWYAKAFYPMECLDTSASIPCSVLWQGHGITASEKNYSGRWAVVFVVGCPPLRLPLQFPPALHLDLISPILKQESTASMWG